MTISEHTAQPSNQYLHTMSSTTQELSSKDLLEAQSHLWNHTFSFINSLSLKCAVELGIADAINNHGKPITLTELTSALSIPPVRIQNFQRLMTLLVHNGYFTVSNNPADSKEEDVYGLTNNSVILVREMGASIAPFIELALDSTLMDSWQTLSSWFKSETPSTAFEKYHGMYVWEAAGKMPEFGKKLRDGFESDSAAVAKVVIEDHGGLLQGINSVVELAGRTGGLALAIAKAFPHIKCTVLDLAHIIDNIDVKHHKVEHVKGDMFNYIPPADVVILKWVLITWNDEECVKILKRCKEAVPTKVKGGKVMVIDKVFNTSDGVDRKIAETQLFFDMQVMVQTTGKVRTEAELKKIFTAAGFKEYKIIPALGMRSVIEIYH